MLVFVEGGKPENPEKNPRSKDENQQQTQPTYDAGSRNQTQATLMGGERARPYYRKLMQIWKIRINLSER